MKEVRKETKVILVKAMCECGGEFKRTTEELKRPFKANYIHRCDSCGKVAAFSKLYPYTIVE